MRYDGGARILRPDGSIEIVGKRLGSLVWLIVVCFAVFPIAGASGLTELIPLAQIAVLLVWARSYRRAARVLVFDGPARMLRVSDRGWRRRERTIAFSAIRTLTVEQRQPRRIAYAPPVLVVDGEPLVSVQDTHANANLERELQALVGLPPHPSPRDTEGLAGP